MARGQINGNEVNFVLERGDPAGGEIAITAILSARHGDPVSGVAILYFLNGVAVGEEETDENGRTLRMVPMQDSTFSVSAQVRGTALTERVQVSVKAKPATSVKNFDARVVTVDEERGLERISIRVTPAKRVHFRITSEGGVVYEGDTDEHGFVLYPQNPTQPFRHTRQMKYVVEVEGIEKQEEFPLEAPPAHPMPSPPPDGLGLLGRWWWRLWHNNNWRLLAAWVVVVVWFCVNIFVFGVGIGSDTSAEWLRYQSMSDAEKFFYESWHRRDGMPLPTSPAAVDQFFGWLGLWSWWLWFWWLFSSVVYIPIALRDELSRAWYRARKTVLERREGVSRGGEAAVQQAEGDGSVKGRQERSQRPFWLDTLLETFHEIVA